MRFRQAIATFRGHHVPNIDFIGRRKYWFALSGLFIVLSLVGLTVRQLNFSIAFTGGSLLEFPNRSGADVQDYQKVMARFGLPDAQVEILGGNEVSIRTESLAQAPTPTPPPTPSPSGSASPSASASPSPSAEASASPSAASPSPGATPSPTVSPTTSVVGPRGIRADELRTALASVAGINVDQINETDVGPTWGSTISQKMATGLIVFLVLVSLYITLRFEWKMALGALGALLHDLVITAGIYSLVGREVTPETVIAILTILGYSLYDTVVIYDKVKENTESAALVAQNTYSGVVNMSLNQTFMRSVNTSLVVLFPIGALLLFGGQTLKDFAFALFIGVASGAYSSIFVASPILAILKEREPRFQQIRMRARTRVARPGLRAVPASSSVAGRTASETPDRLFEPATTSARATGRPEGTAARPRPSGAPTAKRKKPRPQGKPKRRRR